MEDKKPFPWVWVLAVLGCTGILCVGILAVGGGAAYFILRPAERVVTKQTALPTIESLKPFPSATPMGVILETVLTPTPLGDESLLTPTPEPAVVEPPTSENSMFDDFSSTEMGWPVYKSQSVIMGYEDEAYSIHILEPDYYDWAYIPVDFPVREIWFDVRGPEGAQDGTFGVFCQFIDAENYSYVEFDLADNSYVIGQIVADENIPLTRENEAGQYWQVAESLNIPPTATNRIGVTCDPLRITVYANSEMVDDVAITHLFDRPGEAAFFVYTFNFADEDGYQVYFDNVEVRGR
jgi:hypothetical protein